VGLVGSRAKVALVREQNAVGGFAKIDKFSQIVDISGADKRARLNQETDMRLVRGGKRKNPAIRARSISSDYLIPRLMRQADEIACSRHGHRVSFSCVRLLRQRRGRPDRLVIARNYGSVRRRYI
jgi:hypothetical protein